MKLWTIQPKTVIDILAKNGKFTCEETLSTNYEDFKDAYLWLVEQMNLKISNPNCIKLPLWAWHTYEWENSLKHYDFSDEKDDYVCIEFEIDETKVLLSDFDAWHFVLNKWWFDNSYSEEEWNKNQEYFEHLSTSEKEKVMKESWIKIFDISKFQNDWFSRGRYVQATFWELTSDMIKNVTYL